MTLFVLSGQGAKKYSQINGLFCIACMWWTEMSMAVQGPVDPLRELADKLRTRKGIEYSNAKLALPNGGYRVEYVRGKDFARYFQENPDLASFVDSG